MKNSPNDVAYGSLAHKELPPFSFFDEPYSPTTQLVWNATLLKRRNGEVVIIDTDRVSLSELRAAGKKALVWRRPEDLPDLHEV